MEYNFYFTMPGQTLQIVGSQSFLMFNGEVAHRWFNLKERPVVIACFVLSVYLSASINLIIPTMFLSNDHGTPRDVIRTNTRYFNFFRIGSGAFFFVVFMIFFKEIPTKSDKKDKEEK